MFAHIPADLLELSTIMFIAPTSGMLMLLFTLWWNISMHAFTLASAATILTLS